MADMVTACMVMAFCLVMAYMLTPVPGGLGTQDAALICLSPIWLSPTWLGLYSYGLYSYGQYSYARSWRARHQLVRFEFEFCNRQSG